MAFISRILDMHAGDKDHHDATVRRREHSR